MMCYAHEVRKKHSISDVLVRKSGSGSKSRPRRPKSQNRSRSRRLVDCYRLTSVFARSEVRPEDDCRILDAKVSPGSSRPFSRPVSIVAGVAKTHCKIFMSMEVMMFRWSLCT